MAHDMIPCSVGVCVEACVYLETDMFVIICICKCICRERERKRDRERERKKERGRCRKTPTHMAIHPALSVNNMNALR